MITMTMKMTPIIAMMATTKTADINASYALLELLHALPARNANPAIKDLLW